MQMSRFACARQLPNIRFNAPQQELIGGSTRRKPAGASGVRANGETFVPAAGVSGSHRRRRGPAV